MEILIDLTKHPRFAKPRLLLPNRLAGEVIDEHQERFLEWQQHEDQQCPFCGMQSYSEETRRCVEIAKKLAETIEENLRYQEQFFLKLE